ncbi:MAG TPA: nucleotidyltransferase family protein [Vicinamibacterales bacterium]|jgi:hypothetical protein
MPLSAAHRLAAADLLRQRSLANLLQHLASAGVDVLVIKGAALSALLYDEPHVRERCDVDLLVRRDQLDAAEAVILGRGYARQIEPDSVVASGQRHYAPPSPAEDIVDLHWRAANPLAFERVLDFDVVWPRRIPVPTLGPAAATLSIPDALLFACVHRVAHHADSAERRWLDDIDRLVRRLSEADRTQLVEEARRTKTCSVCARSLELAQSSFDTPVDGLVPALRAANAGSEPSAAFIGGTQAFASIVASDLRESGWATRVALVRDHLLPPMSYMRARYPRWPAMFLPLAYAVRVAFGAPAWFRRQP